MTHFVACLDVWAPAVREVVRQTAPPGLDLHFAESYDDDEQFSLMERADFVLAGWAAVTETMLARAPKLRFIEKWGIGIDRIDVDAARRRGVGLAITAGSNSNAVAEHAIALMLSVYRRVAQVDRNMRNGVWLKSEMREVCYQLGGKTVGLVGFGNIGRAVARKLAGFDVRILYADSRRADAQWERKLDAEHASLDRVLAQSDILSLHTPSTPETNGMIGVRALAAMKAGAVLINTARGELVDEQALYESLVSGHLRGAGLDAFNEEPPPANHPLMTLDQVVVTPHIGGAVFDNVANVARHALGNIQRVIDGEPLAAQDIIVPVR